MTQSKWSIPIPLELIQYTNIEAISADESADSKLIPDFGVKLIKDKQGNLMYAAYYSDIGELIKKIYYKGSSVSSIEHYRNNILYSREWYTEGLLTKKSQFNRQGKTVGIIIYTYNRYGQMVAISKSVNGTKYVIEYGYDELKRVNSRTIKVNNIVITEQVFRYDILDRVVNYYDKNQNVKVHKINPNNALIHYTITDRAGNTIEVLNRFMCSEYLATEINLNGHKTTVKDKSYLDNIMLKKPFTSDDDLDFAISNLLRNDRPSSDQTGITRRERSTDISNYIICGNVKEVQKPVPISMRKRQLLLMKAS